MPAADAVLLPLCVGLTLLGVIAVIVFARRGQRGAVVRSVGWTLVPAGLYFSGLLTLVWNGVVAIVGWASRLVFSPAVWAGLSVLVLAVLLIGIGGIVARRSAGRPRPQKTAAPAAPGGRARPAVKSSPAAANPGRGTQPVDEDMAEIEAILNKRGIN